MIYFVYCIFRATREDLPDIIGIEGKPVQFLRAGGLFAAFTEVGERVAPEIPAVLAFEEVIEKIFSETAVIPVRFGNYFDSPDKLQRFLGDNARELERLLDLLRGASEMGIRVLAKRRAAKTSSSGAPPGEHSRESVATGRQYLAGRKTIYESDTLASGRKNEVLEFLEAGFEGLFTSMKSEEVSGLAGALAEMPRPR